MLTILGPDTNAVSPSRSWVEMAWRANPKLAPNWWRENLGFTHSKIVVDARAEPTLSLPEGVNGVLTSGQEFTVEPGVVRVACLKNLDTFKPGCADVLLWSVSKSITEPEALEGLTQLETLVRNGEIEAYGLDDPPLGSAAQHWPLAHWLALAAQAAEAVWGRKKRPGLKVLLVPFDVYACAPLMFNSSVLKETMVPLLEHTAHLNMWVLVAPAGLKPIALKPKTLASLTQLAEAEEAFNQSLNQQWPHVAGQPLFAVLPFLRQGLTPWPHPATVPGWFNHVWPTLQQAFTTFAETPEAQAWAEAWQKVIPEVPALAEGAAQTTLNNSLKVIQPVMPSALIPLSVPLQTVAVNAAVPGVGGVVVPMGFDVTPLQALPDIADIGPLFAPFVDRNSGE